MGKKIKEKIERIVIPTPFSVGDVNIYLLKGEAVSLIDIGPNTEEAWNALVSGLSQSGLKVQDVDQIILTHHHVDHYGLASRLQEEGKAKLYCHPGGVAYITLDEEQIERDVDYFYRFYLQHGVPDEFAQKATGLQKMYQNYGSSTKINGWIEEGSVLPGHEDWTIYHMPGHSQDHLCFYHPEEKIMFSGDHLIKHISSNAILEAPRESQNRPKTLLQYRDSMKRCLELDIQLALSGHGESITDIKELIHQRLDRQEQRAEVIMAEIERSPQTAYSIARALFRDRFNRDSALIMSEIIGHLDLLEDWGWVDQQNEGDQIYYYCTKERN